MDCDRCRIREEIWYEDKIEFCILYICCGVIYLWKFIIFYLLCCGNENCFLGCVIICIVWCLFFVVRLVLI